MRSPVKDFRWFTAALALAIGASGCGPSIDGTWYQQNGKTGLPEKICTGGCQLDVEATMDVDDQAKSFQLTLNMAYTALHDTIDAHGTYVLQDNNLSLTFDGFTIPPTSPNKASVGADGSQCIKLTGFASTLVCFPSPQGHPYTLTEDQLTITLDNAIAGDPASQTTLNMLRLDPGVSK